MSDSRLARTRRASQRANSTTGRRPRAAAGGNSRARRRASEPAMNPAVVMAIVGGGVVVVLALVLMAGNLGGGGGEAAAGQRSDTGGSRDPGAAAAAPAAAPRGQARAGKTPDRPAPEIPADVFVRADVFYDEARQHWNDAVRAKAESRHQDFADSAHAGWDSMEKLYALLDPYTTWYEEADLEGWQIPAQYDAMARKLGPYDRLQQRIKKNMPLREKR